MLGAMLGLMDVPRRMRSLRTTLALLATATAIVAVALGFALSLLYVWLQQGYGTMAALGIIAGGCAGLALVLFLAAVLRPRRLRRPRLPQPASTGERTVDEAIAAVQQGSRESMMAALALAVVTGVTLGRKL